MAKLKELAEFYARAAAMKEPVIKCGGPITIGSPDIDSNMKNWTVEERQPDFQCLIDSGIDCEFSNDNCFWYVGKLKRINVDSGRPYIGVDGALWSQCRPRLNHVNAWLATEDSKCPVPDGYQIKAYFAKDKGGPFTIERPENVNWSVTDMHRIIAFEVLPK